MGAHEILTKKRRIPGWLAVTTAAVVAIAAALIAHFHSDDLGTAIYWIGFVPLVASVRPPGWLLALIAGMIWFSIDSCTLLMTGRFDLGDWQLFLGTFAIFVIAPTVFAWVTRVLVDTAFRFFGNRNRPA